MASGTTTADGVARMWEDLGEAREARLRQGTIRYRERGQGEPILFVHGALVHAGLWRKVVPLLADRYRCIAPTFPLGSHEEPMAPGADLTPPGLARLIADFLAELDLRDVTVVGNDTGGGLSQILVTEHPERVGRLVLTSCDAFSNFPPHATKPFQAVAYVPGSLSAIAVAARRPSFLRASVALLAKHGIPDDVLRSYAGPVISNPAVRRDFGRFWRAIRPRYTKRAAQRLREFRKPAMVAWSSEDKLFPPKHGRQLAELLPEGRYEPIEDAYAFSSEDQPRAVAERVAALMG